MQQGMTAKARRRVEVRRPDDVRSRSAGSATGAPSVTVVMPTLNEAENLAHVLTALPENLFEVVLVDGLSSDGTVEAARRLRPDIRVVMQERRGKGNALALGFAAARGDIIVMIDADGSTDPREIPAFLEALFAGADFAKGSRFLRGGGSADITRIRRVGNSLLSGSVNFLFGTRYSDLCYGFNAFWRDCLPALDVDCDGFEVETLINIRAARAGLRVKEVPSYEHRRLHGVSNLNAVRDGTRVARTIARERLRRKTRAAAGSKRSARLRAADPSADASM
jgi:glycosyltransferase involved in cell wall biosynthesis